MSLLRRIAYMGLRALLVVAVVLGGMVAFAQDDETEAPAVQDDDAAEEESADVEAQDEDTADDESETETPVLPRRGFRGDWDGNDGQLLAEALGITVEELEAAYESANAAAIEQALAEGLITEEQAEQLQERGFGFAFGHAFGRGFGAGLDLDKDELLADALDISVEELEAARAEVREARLAAMVQNAYEAAVEQALADGAITQAQADQLLEALSTSDFGFRGLGEPFGRGGRGHHGGFHHGPGSFFAPDTDDVAPAVEAPADI